MAGYSTINSVISEKFYTIYTTDYPYIKKITYPKADDHIMSWRYCYGLTNVEMQRAFKILMKQARPELRELAINPRIYHAGEEQYAIVSDKDHA